MVSYADFAQKQMKKKRKNKDGREWDLYFWFQSLLLPFKAQFSITSV